MWYHIVLQSTTVNYKFSFRWQHVNGENFENALSCNGVESFFLGGGEVPFAL